MSIVKRMFFLQKMQMPAFIRNARLVHKIRIPIVISLLFIIAQVSINYSSFTSLSQDVRYQNDVLVKSLRLTLDADKDLYQALTNERALIALLERGGSKKDLKKREAKRKKDLKQAQTRFKSAVDLIGGANNKADYDVFFTHYNQWVKMGEASIVLAKKGEFEEATRIFTH